MAENLIHDLLAEMRDEQRAMRSEHKEDHTTLMEKFDTVFKKLGDHETRITVVENTRKTVRWLGGTVIVGGIGFLIDYLFNHVFKHGG